MFRCRHHNFGSKCYFAAANANSMQTTWFRQRITLSLQKTQLWQQTQIRNRQHNFGSETWFAVVNIIRQRKPGSLWTTQFDSKKLIRCGQHKFDSENLIRYGEHNSAANTWFAADNIIGQRTPDSLWNTQFNSEHLIRCGQHNSATKSWFAAKYIIRQETPDSLRTTQIRQRKPDSLRTTQIQ